MAADRATVSISASLLPDEIKTSVGGTLVYDLNDYGDNNKWSYSLTIVGATSEDALLPTVAYLGQGSAEEGGTASVAADDDVLFLFIKHTGTTDGSTATTATLAINLAGTAATGSAAGDIVLKPGECFAARMGTANPMANINADSSSGNIQAMVFVIADDGGV
jgi:hypothetical protein|tara:strand:- start:27 stop:515 length:489 start_codon:yes stop_codon:yes gene_type:complete